MTNTLNAVIGQWYQHLDKGESFQVVDINRTEDWRTPIEG